MNVINYNYINSPANQLIYTDGSVLTAETYATYDQNWFLALLNLLETFFHDAWKFGQTYPPVTAIPLPLRGQTSNQVKIAIVGDWGTGNDVSGSVMNLVTSLNPDYIVHVGDVYYSGTPSAGTPHGPIYFSTGEEMSKLVNKWPSNYAGKSFTLNSNHEMYAGANGYFDEGLAPNGPFSAQRGQGCFALKYKDWTIVGLDSAYLGSTIDAFMTGTIGGANGVQGTWLQSLHLDPQKTIVLTHHNGFADDCSSVSPLWAQIKGALNGDPYAWYWGHVHNGIVYNSPVTIPSSSSAPGITTRTYARCLGHGALPYGNAVSLNGKPIKWRETVNQPGKQQLYNGFAIITLTVDNESVTNVSESFYNLSKRIPVYTGQIFSAISKKQAASSKKKPVKKPAVKKQTAKKKPANKK